MNILLVTMNVVWTKLGTFFYNVYVAAAAKSLQLCPTLCDPIDCSPQAPRPWNSPGKNTGVGCHLFHNLEPIPDTHIKLYQFSKQSFDLWGFDSGINKTSNFMKR